MTKSSGVTPLIIFDPLTFILDEGKLLIDTTLLMGSCMPNLCRNRMKLMEIDLPTVLPMQPPAPIPYPNVVNKCYNWSHFVLLVTLTYRLVHDNHFFIWLHCPT